MINVEAQKNKFVDSFCKATGIDREFAEKVFSYISFHNSVDGLVNYFYDFCNQHLSINLGEDGNFTYRLAGDKGTLTLEEVYKLYKEVTAS
jgi:hypothetical protein